MFFFDSIEAVFETILWCFATIIMSINFIEVSIVIFIVEYSFLECYLSYTSIPGLVWSAQPVFYCTMVYQFYPIIR